jgi:predicted metal-dependent phosphoesterase TrpH
VHIHTNYSDGVFALKKWLSKYTAEVGSCRKSITDHDCVDGIDETLEIASKTGLEVFSRIELSFEVLDSKKSKMHIYRL